MAKHMENHVDRTEMENRWFLRAPKCHLRERRCGGWRRVWLRMGGGLQRPLLPPSTASSCPSRGTLSSCRWCSMQSQSGKWQFSFICSMSKYVRFPNASWLSLTFLLQRDLFPFDVTSLLVDRSIENSIEITVSIGYKISD